jgi:hypothetical protein
MAAVASLQELPEKPAVFIVVEPSAEIVMLISCMLNLPIPALGGGH